MKPDEYDLLGGFKGGFVFFLNKKSVEEYETDIKFFHVPSFYLLIVMPIIF